MIVRNAVRASTTIVLALVFVSAAAGGPGKGSPNGPTNLRITASTDRSVSLAWDAAKSGGTNWWYCVRTNGAGCFRVDPPNTTFTHPSLWPGSTYTFTVVTVSSSGQVSAPSNAVTFTTPPDTTPPTAPLLSVTGTVYPTRATLTWTQSSDASQVSYTFLVDGAPYTPTGVSSSTVIDLAPESTHTFQVKARDYFGNTSESNVVTVTTPAATDAVAPSAPANLRLSPETSVPEIWLDWDGATDNSDAAGEIMYEIFVNGARVSAALGHTDDIVYCQATGENRIAVRAVDTSGNASAFSNELNFVC